MTFHFDAEQPQSRFVFWTPPEGRTVELGPEQRPVTLGSDPLPLHRVDAEEGEPDNNAIGQGLYDFLRQFPDAEEGRYYAELLRDAFPHFLAELAAQTLMLEHKEVDAPYIRRKIVGLKIFALLEPKNPGLLQQLGTVCYQLAMMFSELRESRRHLLAAMNYLQRGLQLAAEDPHSLNLLGQIAYWLGDYPSAARHWRGTVALLADGAAKMAILAKITVLENEEAPDHPLVDDLEQIGDAMLLLGNGDSETACLILERLEEENIIPQEMPTAQFYHLLGRCRELTGDAGGAFAAYDQALELDPDYLPAQEGKERIVEGEGS
ncbi:MAG: hypothetical protein C0621_09500 [Desulfuromonas sp.]|nr:MAG: hypothetical protein C0621_09500 [Desulfuromonas sp.]